MTEQGKQSNQSPLLLETELSIHGGKSCSLGCSFSKSIDCFFLILTDIISC